MFQREDQAGTAHPPIAAWTTCSWLRGRGFGVKGRRGFFVSKGSGLRVAVFRV